MRGEAASRRNAGQHDDPRARPPPPIYGEAHGSGHPATHGAMLAPAPPTCSIPTKAGPVRLGSVIWRNLTKQQTHLPELCQPVNIRPYVERGRAGPTSHTTTDRRPSRAPTARPPRARRARDAARQSGRSSPKLKQSPSCKHHRGRRPKLIQARPTRSRASPPRITSRLENRTLCRRPRPSRPAGTTPRLGKLNCAPPARSP